VTNMSIGLIGWFMFQIWKVSYFVATIEFIKNTFRAMLALHVYQEVCKLNVPKLHIYHANYRYVLTISITTHLTFV
jgi:hypothetical protein